MRGCSDAHVLRDPESAPLRALPFARGGRFSNVYGLSPDISGLCFGASHLS